MKISYLLSTAVAVVILSGCGSDSSTPASPNNEATQNNTTSQNDTSPPTFTSSNTATVAENITDAVTLVATDANVITYSISGGDSADFNINSTSGAVTFKTAPDFETKQNYEFEAKATDGANNETTQTLTIIVTDVDETTSAEPTNAGTITSLRTERVWMDRNLGATMVCTESRDSGSFADDAAYVASQQACFGDYYQWGRDTDGHEKSNSATVEVDYTQTNVNPGHGNFITLGQDWVGDDVYGKKRASWNPCPIGFRIPTIKEIESEKSYTIYNRDNAYSKLKLPSAGSRNSDGSLLKQGSYSSIWSSSVNSNLSSALFFYGTDESPYYNDADVYHTSRAIGRSVRCIKD